MSRGNSIGGAFTRSVWTLLKGMLRLIGVCIFGICKLIEASAAFVSKIFERSIM